MYPLELAETKVVGLDVEVHVFDEFALCLGSSLGLSGAGGWVTDDRWLSLLSSKVALRALGKYSPELALCLCLSNCDCDVCLFLLGSQKLRLTPLKDWLL